MDLESIIFGKKRERILTEGTEIGGIICPLIKMNRWDVFIYGGGIDVSAIILYFLNLGIHIKGILDCDPQKDGKIILDEVPIMNPNKISVSFTPEKTIVIINTFYYKGIEQFEIISLLLALGIKKFYELNAYEKRQIKVDTQIWVDAGRIEYYYEHYDALMKTYNALYDKKSKEIMLEFIRAYMELGTYGLKQCSSDVKYFYGQNPDMSKEEIYRHLDDEVWINCGSHIGDNIFWYFANGLNAKAIYAYEADTGTYSRLIKNLKYLPESYRRKVFPINELIDYKTDWKLLDGDKVTLINADIEGAELDLLKSMKEMIMRCRPVLAICAYHKASDLIELPEFIKEIVKEYCFVLRKYETNTENIRRTGELVLYAIPKERMNDKVER